MRPLIIASGANGHPTFSIPTSDSINAVSLTANTAESITIPSGATYVMFSATDDFYANYTTTATVPTDTVDGSAAELNPIVRTLLSSDTISVISESTCKVTATFYSEPSQL